MAARLLEMVTPGATVLADKANDTDGIRSFAAVKLAATRIWIRAL